MSSFAEEVAKIDQSVDNLRAWKVQQLPLTVAKSLEDDAPVVINLATTIGHKVKPGPNEVDRHWLQKDFSENSPEFRKKKLAPMVARMCLQQGFTSILKGWENKKSKAVFVCSRGRYYHRNRNKSPENNPPQQSTSKEAKGRTTRRPVREQDSRASCPFSFVIYWSEEKQRWFVPHKQAGSNAHLGHSKLQPQSVPVLSKTIPEEDRKKSSLLLEARIKPTQVEDLQHRELGYSLTQSQLRKQRAREKQQRRQSLAEELRLEPHLSQIVGEDGMLPFEDQLKTPADKLLFDLDVDEDASYVALYAEFDTSALTIRQKNKEMTYHKIEAIDANGLRDHVESAAQSAHKIRRSLSITGSGLILLAIVWTDSESSRRFEMFPEMMACDTTYKTNEEDRPLFICAGKDSNNQSFTHTWGFLPSQALWTFNWVFQVAMKAIHRREALDGVRVACTDQDGQLYNAFEYNSAQYRQCTFPNSIHRLCAWHKLDRNLVDHKDFKADIGKLKNTDLLEFRTIHGWFWDFITHVESPGEARVLTYLLEEYLSENEDLHRGKIGEKLREKLASFFRSSLQDLEHKYYHYYFTGCFNLNIQTSVVAEVENHALKYSVGGPSAYSDIAESHEALAYLQAKKERGKQKQAARDIDSIPSQFSARVESVTEVTKYCNEKLQAEYKARRNYLCCKTSEEDFLVKYKLKDEPLPHSDSDGIQFNVRKKHRYRWIKPRFERTRLLTIHRESKDVFLVCRCAFFNVYGIACRHVYAVLDRTPTRTDTMPRWWKNYSLVAEGAVDFAVRDQLLRLQAISRTMVGVPLLQGEEAESNLSSIPQLSTLDLTTREFFDRSPVNLPYLKVDGTYWATESGQALLQRVKTRHGVIIANHLTSVKNDFPVGNVGSPFGLTQEIKLAQVSCGDVQGESDDDDLPTGIIDWSSEGSGETESSEDRAIKAETMFGIHLLRFNPSVSMQSNLLRDTRFTVITSMKPMPKLWPFQ